jgi:hypothetical protein
MGVPTSEVGYTTAMPKREDHEVHKDMWWHWIKKEHMKEPIKSSINLGKDLVHLTFLLQNSLKL